jgi:NAD(P)H-hydrate epimerase
MQDLRDEAGGELFTAEQARAIDTRAIEEYACPSYGLMQQAAARALIALRAEWPGARELLVWCGAGNNGGDGYVLARDASRQGWRVTVIAVAELSRLTGDAALAAKDCQAAGVAIISLASLADSVEGLAKACEKYCGEADVIVDALLGTGLRSAVREPFAAVIEAINAVSRPVLALDVPSGLCADTGRVQSVAVRASVTVTFIVDKAGLWLNDGPRYAGRRECAPLEIPAAARCERPRLRRLTATALARDWAARDREAHKGQAGHVVVVGGGDGMPGAARMTAEAALAVGAGRVTVLCAGSSAAAIASGPAEVMVSAIDNASDATRRLDKADVIALGPGLGLDEWAQALFSLVISLHKPMVIDADALTLLATNEPNGMHAANAANGVDLAQSDRVLTPHPGEAARLLGVTSAQIQTDRMAALAELCTRYAGVSVLKGAGTLVGHPDELPALCAAGNPAMATAGMGDVLTGIIAGLRAQGVSPWQAACTGVWLHAAAGDRLASRQKIDRGLRASQLVAELPALLGELIRGRR